MDKNLSPVLRDEQENLDKDAENCDCAIEALKSYAENADPRTIPLFLAKVSETRELGSSLGECAVSLYEVLARVHGPNIAPYIDDIMSDIVHTLLSSSGSSALYQDCSSVVPTIARHGIDPLMPENEKKRIIRCLAKPLSDLLMGPLENAASCAALCLKCLVESDNWRFASDDMVNEICLKVAGALEEKQTQTDSHMGLVVSLMKQNGLVAEPYARSLIRSGLQILSAGVKECESPKKLPAIRMINFLMQGVDSRSISSEIFKVVDAMEKHRNDNLLSVRVAASEALQTAKMVAGQKVSREEISSSPLVDSNFERRHNRRHSWVPSSTGIADAWRPGSPAELPFPELQTSDSLVDYDTLMDSRMSTGRSFDCMKRTNRRLWSNGNSGMDTTSEDGFFLKSCSRGGGSTEQFRYSELSTAHKKTDINMSRFGQPNAMNVVSRASTPSPQRSRPHTGVHERSRSQPSFDGVKRSLTPRNLIQSLQNSTDAISECLERHPTGVAASPTIDEMEFNITTTLDEDDDHSHNMNSEFIARGSTASTRRLTKQKSIPDDAQPDIDYIGSAPSISGDPSFDSCKTLGKAVCEGKTEVQILKAKRRGCGKAALSTMFCLSVVIFAVILSGRWINNNDDFSHVVPT